MSVVGRIVSALFSLFFVHLLLIVGDDNEGCYLVHLVLSFNSEHVDLVSLHLVVVFDSLNLVYLH